MSACCREYPDCKCSKIERDEKGFPLLEDGSIDWDLTSKEKSAHLEEWERKNNREGGSAKVRNKFPSNRIPPKKKRKK